MISTQKKNFEFNKNVLTLLTGTTVAQAIPVAISPILTRIYTPEDFGLFAIFIAMTAIFGSIVNARYDLAIMLPKKNEDAINLFALGFLITTIISSFFFVLVIIFNQNLVHYLGNKEIGIWLYFLPITIFLTGIWNILSHFNNRKKKYKILAKATILKSILLASFQLCVGYFKSGVTGLISGQIISHAFVNIKLILIVLKDKTFLSKISKNRMIFLGKRYINFPKFLVWGVLANALSYNLINILISMFYSVTTLGFFSLVQRLLGVPSSLIGQSIGQVYFQQAVREKQKTGRAIKTFNGALKKLLIIGVPSFGFLFFFAEELFAIIFGENWRMAGKYAKILLPLFFIRFVSSSLSSTNVIFEKQKIGLYINLILLISSTGLLLYSHFLSLEFEKFLYYFSILLSLEYLSFLIYYRQLAYRVTR